MGKKSILVLSLFLSAFSMSGCRQNETLNSVAYEETIVSSEIQSDIEKVEKELQSTEEASTSEPVTEEELTEAAIPQKITIYYGNGEANGLKVDEALVSDINADTLLSMLARHNIVSIDTKVQHFEKKQENKNTVLYLDLSKQFEDYVNMMGKDGEYIVIAGLTNTFLDTFQATQLKLSVNGKNLKTNNNDYEEPLTFYPLQEKKKQNTTYELEETVMENDNISIRYPQFKNMENEKIMNLWNEWIKNAAISNSEETGIEEYELNYEIMTKNAGMVSMILRGYCYYQGAAYPYSFATTFNFDLTTGKNLRLSKYKNVEELADYIENGYGYQVLNKDISREELTEYLKNNKVQDCKELLEGYDYDLSNENLIPTGYSYIKNDQILVLVIEVPHVLGDYVEIEIV